MTLSGVHISTYHINFPVVVELKGGHTSNRTVRRGHTGNRTVRRGHTGNRTVCRCSYSPAPSKRLLNVLGEPPIQHKEVHRPVFVAP